MTVAVETTTALPLTMRINETSTVGTFNLKVNDLMMKKNNKDGEKRKKLAMTHKKIIVIGNSTKREYIHLLLRFYNRTKNNSKWFLVCIRGALTVLRDPVAD